MMLVLVVIYNNTNDQTGEWQKSIVERETRMDSRKGAWTYLQLMDPHTHTQQVR